MHVNNIMYVAISAATTHGCSCKDYSCASHLPHFKVVQNIAYIIRGVTYELVVLQ